MAIVGWPRRPNTPRILRECNREILFLKRSIPGDEALVTLFPHVFLEQSGRRFLQIQRNQALHRSRIMGEIQQGGSHLKILPQQDGNPATGRVLRPSRLKKSPALRTHGVTRTRRTLKQAAMAESEVFPLAFDHPRPGVMFWSLIILHLRIPCSFMWALPSQGESTSAGPHRPPRHKFQ